MRKLLLLVSMCMAMLQPFAQSRTVSGIVTDQNGAAVSGASVTVKGGNAGTTTSGTGAFTLSVPASAKTLVISSLNFTSVEVSIGSGPINVTLSPSNNAALDEVVVVAYGTVKKSENTSATAQVSANEIKNRPMTNITSALEGAAPGIQTLSANGQPGSGQTVRLRGFGSLNASNDPLYIVDGVPYTGALSNINMDDVESISALKDAAQTALYGSRAANGVVVITTKRGKKNRNTMSVRGLQGFTSRAIPEYDRVDAYQYYPLMWQAMRNSLVYTTGQAPATAATNATNGIKGNLGYNPFNVADNNIVRTDGTLNPDARLKWADDLDWGSELVRTGTRSDYSINFSGGNDKSDYFASVGYLNEKGFVIRSDFRKWTGRVNLNIQPTSWFRSGVNVSGTMTNSNTASDGSSTGYVNPFFFTRNIGPIYPVYAHVQATGDYMLNSAGQRFYDYGNLSALGIPNRPAGASAGRHIVEETKRNAQSFRRSIASARAYGEILFTKNLKLQTNISVDNQNAYSSTYDNNLVGDGAPAGRASKTQALVTTYTFNQLLFYNKRFGKHNVEAFAGHENYDRNENGASASAQGQTVEGNYELTNFATINGISSQEDNQKIESYLSRLKYDYAGKYFLSLSGRRDGNSRFKEEFRWENFWSAGAAWAMEKENFMKNVPWINQLKVRASYGLLGNDAGIGFYPYQALYGLGFNNANENGIRQSALPNDSITWETSKNFETGIDFSVLKNRLRGSVSYYNKRTVGLIFGVQLPLSNGGYTLNKNIGEMQNKGFEFELSGDVIRKKDFNWEVGVNVSTLKNALTKMPPGQPEIISGTKKLMVGHSIYDFWLREWRGVDPNDGAALYTALNGTATGSRILKTGDTVTTNQNNAKLVYSGSAIPDFWGSISTNVSYKAFELSVLLAYQVGGEVYDATYAALMDPGTYGAAFHTDALSAWKAAGDITNVPRMDNSKGGVFNAQSTRFLTDASYLTVRTVSLSYELPKSIVSKLTASNARFFMSGENLGIFTKRKGMNAQQAFTGVTSNAYVPAKIFTVGINVNF